MTALVASPRCQDDGRHPLTRTIVRTLSLPVARASLSTCLDHLRRFGARVEKPPADAAFIQKLAASCVLSLGAKSPITCDILWSSVANQEIPRSESLIQAQSGLMRLHGRDADKPQRLGLDVCSTVAGILAAQGILAATFAHIRGGRIDRVETSLLQAATLLLGHHLAIETCRRGSERKRSPGARPPFCTCDGFWIELEFLTADSWAAFWAELVVAQEIVKSSWVEFVSRYLRAQCSLPLELHRAVVSVPLDRIRLLARATGAACRVLRSPTDVLNDLPRSTLAERELWSIQPLGSAPLVRVPQTLQSSRAPLAGVKVVELTSRLQGPLAGLLLQMLGAEVTKIEPPGGDFGRRTPPYTNGCGAAWFTYNRGKRIVEIDVKRSAGYAEILDLVRDADVVLHNWRPQKDHVLGLNFERLAGVNPNLIFAHASGWGRQCTDPAEIAGDFVVQAQSGLGYGLRPVSDAPFPSQLTFLDVTGGLLACEAILAALCIRETTGGACRVDTSLWQGALVHWLAVFDASPTRTEFRRHRWESIDEPLQTSNGWLMLDVAHDQRESVFEFLCGSSQSRSSSRIKERLRERSTSEWETEFASRGILATAIREDIASLVTDPDVDQCIESVDGQCWTFAVPWRLSASGNG